MRVLFDHNVPSGIAGSLKEHSVTLTVERGWERMSNGELLSCAEAAGFEVIVTADKNIRYQQNLKHRRIALVLLSNPTWRDVQPFVERIVYAVNAATINSFTEVDIPRPPKKPFVRP